jgi:hypothetical protein
VTRTAVTGTPPSHFDSQRYDLANFLSFMGAGENLQQCDDNANLLTIFARSLGVNVTPKWVAATMGLMKPATYYPAGRDTQQINVQFTFHQFGFFNNMVYDASTRATLVGDPNMGQSLDDYMNTVFGMAPADFRSLDVTTLTIGTVPYAAFRVTGATPNHASVGTTTTVTITGDSFSTAVRVQPRASDLIHLATGVMITNRTFVDSHTIRVDLVIDPAAVARDIKLVLLSPTFELLGTADFTLDPSPIPPGPWPPFMPNAYSAVWPAIREAQVPASLLGFFPDGALNDPVIAAMWFPAPLHSSLTGFSSIFRGNYHFVLDTVFDDNSNLFDPPWMN